MNVNATTRERLPLLRAWPHRWGSGMVHQIDPDHDQTLCGKSPGGCPGDKFDGTADLITCKGCLKSREARVRAAERRNNFTQQQANYDEQQRKWLDAYIRYLSSGEWFSKRAKVMRRAGGMCEGCGFRPAMQVHHLRYPRNCQPGSDEWIAQEKLFDLRAICRECHEDVHQR